MGFWNFIKETCDTIVAFFNNYNYSSLYLYIHDWTTDSELIKKIAFSKEPYFPQLQALQNKTQGINFLSNISDWFICFISTNYYFIKISNIFFSFGVSSNTVDAISVSLKFLACIALLIFARGGIPRFRFDYLTKLGWIRFLSLVLLSFLIEILILSMY